MESHIGYIMLYGSGSFQNNVGARRLSSVGRRATESQSVGSYTHTHVSSLILSHSREEKKKKLGHTW